MTKADVKPYPNLLQELEDQVPTRQDLRAVLANPDSTQEQVLQAKLVLARRIAEGSNRALWVCEHYLLTPEQTEKMMTRHEEVMEK